MLDVLDRIERSMPRLRADYCDDEYLRASIEGLAESAATRGADPADVAWYRQQLRRLCDRHRLLDGLEQPRQRRESPIPKAEAASTSLSLPDPERPA